MNPTHNPANLSPGLPVPSNLNQGLSDLTLREWEILIHLANDSPKTEIANKLCLAEKSVENYYTRIGHKLNLTGAGKLARFARKHVTVLQLYYEQLFQYLLPLKLNHK